MNKGFLLLTIIIGSTLNNAHFLEIEKRQLQQGFPPGPSGTPGSFKEIDIKTLENLLKDLVNGNQQAEDLINKIDQKKFEDLQNILYRNLMLDALTQQFIETAGMPLIAKLEEDKNKMRILSNKFVRMEFADYYPSSFDTSDTDNLLTAIKLCKDKNVLENFQLSLAQDQAHLEEKFVQDQKSIFQLGLSESFLILKSATPSWDQKQLMDKSQILVDIPVLEKAMNISKKFFLELAEGDKEQQQLIEETYSQISEAQNLQNLVFQYIKDPEFKTNLDQIISQVKSEAKNADLVTVFEEIQKNQDLVKQIQKGDVKDLDSLTKEMVNNTKAIQQIIEKQAAATAAQISSQGKTTKASTGGYDYPAASGESLAASNNSDDGSSVFWILALITALIIGGVFIYRFIRRKFAVESSFSAEGGSFQQMA